MDKELFNFILFFLAFWIIIVYAGIVGIRLGYIKISTWWKEGKRK